MKKKMRHLFVLILSACLCSSCAKTPADQSVKDRIEQSESLPVPEIETVTIETIESTAMLQEWDGMILGMPFDRDATEIDLTPIIARAAGEGVESKTAYQYGLEFRVMGQSEENPSAAKVLPDHPFPDRTSETNDIIAEVEEAMAYYPHVEKVILCGAWLNNEAMSEFRERNREKYKVVWSVKCGDIAPRTDGRIFMPTKYFVEQGKFTDQDAYNLRYCEEMICIDLGHMMITNVDFAAFMPQLKYLVVSKTPTWDLTGLQNCENLVFLEMAWSYVSDLSPLVGCTALEDLNIGGTYGDVEDILEMTWLKNLWIVGTREGNYEKVAATLTDTYIADFVGDPVFGEWRKLPNYYKMRDALLMFYME